MRTLPRQTQDWQSRIEARKEGNPPEVAEDGGRGLPVRRESGSATGPGALKNF